MVDAARQMLDELMGRNRNLHPSEAPRKISWDDPDFCQYYVVKFCPHDLFINTRADLGPCTQIHDDEAKRLYEEARPSPRKRSYEDEFLRFCNNMLNDVDRKIQKGKQRLQLMQRDQPIPTIPLSKYEEQLNNMNARIKKLLSEAEEAGIRGDVDQAKDLMALCEQLKDEKDALMAQHEQHQQLHQQTNGAMKDSITNSPPQSIEREKSPKNEEGASTSGSEKKILPWMQDLGTLPEKQMEVCEICGAFLIVGDAQQRIEDHLMGKQHLGYSRLRKAVEEIHERRQNDREEEERKRREEREQRSVQRNAFGNHNDRRRSEHHDHRDRDRERERDNRGRSRDHSSRHSADRHRHHHKSSHRRRSHSRSSHRRSSRDRYSRSRSRSHSRY
ncbi:PREDICTED: luc7-like protein 3 isoform X1 [Rhagoletis zephyria]|uniref:luc7-like protein 3 isoform X1 n=1 Tax=Rhagoletis zephyria TaxID=28612 RepID=UPI000811233E|nr:PREDICTED: luc7-like protein 3 isoform X1 [Rhagoletis zephyria]